MQIDTKVLRIYDEINKRMYVWKFFSIKKPLENSGTKVGLTMWYTYHRIEFLIQMLNTWQEKYTKNLARMDMSVNTGCQKHKKKKTITRKHPQKI